MNNIKVFPSSADELSRTFFACYDKLLLPGTSRHMKVFYLRLMAYCSRKLSANSKNN